ncbi:uncharacterized protein LOC129609252 [Condylostylus longicornis]|uniref:uncharacterized protein LOC129609252 n=1 Tax=Condylostylus longicornis TaxID=2530218 RepID=UPI00244DB96C|nr:uncharacterized protein LOC129609252 [Condylostylus longicornis]
MSLLHKYIQVHFVEENIKKFILIEKSKENINCHPEIVDFYDVLSSIQQFTTNKNFSHFTDASGTEISENILVRLLSQYIYCANFVLHYHCNPTYVSTNSHNVEAKSSLIIDAETLKNYIIKENGSCIFENYKRSNSITDKNRRHLVRIVAKFIMEKFESKANKRDKTHIAKLLVDIFPCFKANTVHGGSEIFYNPTNNSGFFVSQLKFLNFKKKHFKEKRKIAVSEIVAAKSKNKKLTEEDLEFFKEFNWKPKLPLEKNLLIKKLKETASARKEFLKDAKDVSNLFPFYLKDAKIILLDFEILYPEIKESLENNWKKVSKQVMLVLQHKGLEDHNISEWHESIQEFIALLKCFPPPAGKTIKSRSNFCTCVAKFIRFYDSNEDIQKIIPENKQPVIIVTGTSKKDITKYFISVDKKLLSIPNGFDFIKVFDIYFKMFYVFNIEYDNDLRIFMLFFQKYIYNFPKVKETPRLIEIWNMLQNFTNENCGENFETVLVNEIDVMENIKIEFGEEMMI